MLIRMENSSVIVNTNFPLPFGPADAIGASISLIILCVVGFISNAWIIFTILYSRKLRSPLFFIILSLSVSDFLSAVISPIALNRLIWGYDVWNWANFFCKIYWAVDIWTSYVTSLHILFFSGIRLYSVLWPFRYRSFTEANAKVIILVIWFVTFGSGFFPNVLWYTGVTRNRTLIANEVQYPSCSFKPEVTKSVKLYQQIAYPIFFYVSFVLIVIFSIGLIIKIILHTKKKRLLAATRNTTSSHVAHVRRNKVNKVRLIQLALIVGSFMLGYIPRTAYHFYSIERPITPGMEPYPWKFAFVEYFLLRISECLNPIFYIVSSSDMRKETITILMKAWSKMKRKSNGSTATVTTVDGENA